MIKYEELKFKSSVMVGLVDKIRLQFGAKVLNSVYGVAWHGNKTNVKLKKALETVR